MFQFTSSGAIMYNPTFTNPNNALLQGRLNRAINTLRALSYPTREQYQATVYNIVNKIINIGYAMTPLKLINAYTPAKIGDYEKPVTTLNNDASDIINEVNRVENLVSTYYNLAAAAENTLRQQIRSTIYSSTQNLFYEGFIDSTQIASSSTGQIDANAGCYTNPVTTETILSPTVTIGAASIGSISSGSLTNITEQNPTTYLEWEGTVLELVFTFSTITPINRIYLKQYDYQDISITSLTTTPDGNYIQDILADDLGVNSLLCGVTANKSAAENTIDFSPKNCQTLSLILTDLTGQGSINLDWVQLVQREYQSSAILNSIPITTPLGQIVFNADVVNQEPYSLVSHQISYDGTTFSGITPGQVLNITSSTYWYRAILSLNESLITQSGQSVNTGLDPSSSTNYTISSISSVSIGNNLIVKTLVFTSISGPVVIQDPLLVNTLYLQQGASILSKNSYTFVNGTLTLAVQATNVTVVYQTSTDTTSLSSLLDYFSPILVSYSFEAL